tara:strand:+ start:1577 stop:1867 length:291 start_codon:yes stop_codon:yes gene_type:complete
LQVTAALDQVLVDRLHLIQAQFPGQGRHALVRVEPGDDGGKRLVALLVQITQVRKHPAAHRGILDIALDYGFTDSATFSRAFKAAFGVSPSEWRQR